MKKPSLLIIFLTVFIDLIGFGIVLPLLPKYSERFGAKGIWIGLIISSFSIMQFIFAPAWGRLSDRIGRRPVLLISNFGSAASYALFAYASYFQGSKALIILMFSRVFAGICGANLSVASAYIADITEPEKRSKSMGLIGMAFGLGFILGPALGGVSAGKWGLAAPGWLAASFCAANFVLGCFILKESRKPGTASTVSRPRLQQWLHVIQHPKLGALIGIYFLATFSFACFESTLPILVGSSNIHRDEVIDPAGLAKNLKKPQTKIASYLDDKLSPATTQDLNSWDSSTPLPNELRNDLLKDLNSELKDPAFYDPDRFAGIQLRPLTTKLVALGADEQTLPQRNRALFEDAFPGQIAVQTLRYDERHVGYIFAYCGLIAAFIQGGAIGRLIKAFGDPKLISGSLILVAISLAIIPYMTTLAGLLIALGIFASGSGINRAPTMGQISLNAPKEEQGAVLGIAQSTGTLARIVGPPFATALFYVHKPIPYVITACVALIAGLLAFRLLCKPGTSPHAP